MATNQKDTFLARSWLWLSVWLAFIATYFFRTNAYEIYTIPVTPSTTNPITSIELPTVQPLSIEPLQTNVIDVVEPYIEPIPVTKEHKEIRSFILNMELEVVKNLNTYALKLFNDNHLNEQNFDEILNRIDVLRESTHIQTTLDETEYNMILLMIINTLNQIQTLHTIETHKANQEATLLEELEALEKEFEEITESEIMQYDDLSDIDLDDISLSDYEDEDDIEIEPINIPLEAFTYDALIDKIQSQIDTIQSADKLLTKLDDSVFSLLHGLVELFDKDDEKASNIRDQLEKINPNAHKTGLHAL
jgi:hypothetical protein